MLIIAYTTEKRQGQMPLSQLLFHCIQHGFHGNAVASAGVVHQNVGDGADKFPILNDRRAAHE